MVQTKHTRARAATRPAALLLGEAELSIEVVQQSVGALFAERVVHLCSARHDVEQMLRNLRGVVQGPLLPLVASPDAMKFDLMPQLSTSAAGLVDGRQVGEWTRRCAGMSVAWLLVASGCTGGWWPSWGQVSVRMCARG